MFKDVAQGLVKCDDERVGTLPTRLAFVEMSKFHIQGSKLLFLGLITDSSPQLHSFSIPARL
jgi:hypothetical protein